MTTWKQWIKRQLTGDALDKEVEQALCATLEHELTLLDRSINFQGKSALTPTGFNESFSMLTPAGHVPWVKPIAWPRRDVEVARHTGIGLTSTPHRDMWRQFQDDFPIVHWPYRMLQLRGLFRTGVEIHTTATGDEVLRAIYYTFVPSDALRDEDRAK